MTSSASCREARSIANSTALSAVALPSVPTAITSIMRTSIAAAGGRGQPPRHACGDRVECRPDLGERPLGSHVVDAEVTVVPVGGNEFAAETVRDSGENLGGPTASLGSRDP